VTSLEQEIAKLLREKGLSLGVVESASGGLLSHLITNVPGSSDYYQGSITAYSNQIKIRVVGVSQDTIKKYGAVSHEVAREMARGGRRVLDSDICLSDTGIAGPGGASPEKPVGLFYLSLAYAAGTESRKHTFSGDREQRKLAAAQAALAWLKEYLLSLG
jgi:nicotinamide-nucleotide amidase